MPPGKPGAEPRWTSSRKSGVGTANSAESPVWFTVAHGILNELYYPTMDQANTRDVGFLVAADDGFFSEEKRHTHHDLSPLEQGVAGYHMVNTCERGRYRITKTLFTDPRRPALLVGVRFEPLVGQLRDYRLYVLLAPHIGNQGAENDGWSGEFKGMDCLFAQRGFTALALACSRGWRARSCGYVGASDGWQQVSKAGRLTDLYPEARQGNIALTGEVELSADGSFTLAIGFGSTATEAAHHARAALLSDFEDTRGEFVQGWRRFQQSCLPLVSPRRAAFDVYRVSTAVLRTHESKRYHGGIIASLSIPWGEQRGDRDIGGYHLVWPRDQIHAAFGLLAAGQETSARQTMFHLMCTQEREGNWPQNMWVDGRAYWTAYQGDQTASFLLLADALRRLGRGWTVDPWPSVQRAAASLIRHGPVTDQDRWEENQGYTPYTLATTVAGLLAAADFADERGDTTLAQRCRATADDWNSRIESWLYVTDTPLSRKLGVEGYYVRLAPPETKTAEDLKRLTIPLRNYAPPEAGQRPAAAVVSPDALALVRYGLRAADDPRIINTVRVIDATLRRDTNAGPVWRRYTDDAYGETADGDPFAGAGVGHGWPLLTGERAHYELACGRHDEAERLLEAMVRQSHAGGGLFPEQVWDENDLPGRALFNGQPTGSALPLVWTHAEFVTLLRSMRDRAVFDCPPQTVARYRMSA